MYPGKLQVNEPHVIVPVDDGTTVKALIREALNKFGLYNHTIEDYRYRSLLGLVINLTVDQSLVFLFLISIDVRKFY